MLQLHAFIIFMNFTTFFLCSHSLQHNTWNGFELFPALYINTWGFYGTWEEGSPLFEDFNHVPHETHHDLFCNPEVYLMVVVERYTNSQINHSPLLLQRMLPLHHQVSSAVQLVHHWFLCPPVGPQEKSRQLTVYLKYQGCVMRYIFLLMVSARRDGGECTSLKIVYEHEYYEDHVFIN